MPRDKSKENFMNDTERIDKLESALRDSKLKLNITQDGVYIAGIYDLREWVDSLARPKIYRKPPPRTRKPKINPISSSQMPQDARKGA
jgi:hypothetical protein